MYLEVKRRRDRTGILKEWLYSVRYERGVRKRTYVKASDAPKFIERYKLERKARQPKPVKPPGKAGRPRQILKELKEIATAAGYSARGVLLMKSKKTFFSFESAVIRFSLLDTEFQTAVGSPDNLLQANAKAQSLLKRRNRLSQATSYQECLAEILTSTEL